MLPCYWVIAMILDYNLVGKRIKERRIEMYLTQESIAEHLDISISYISRIERAAAKISLETLVKIASYLDVSPAYLIDGAVTNSKDYLKDELAKETLHFTPSQMNLLLKIVHAIKVND